MPKPRNRRGLAPESLEARLALSTAASVSHPVPAEVAITSAPPHAHGPARLQNPESGAIQGPAVDARVANPSPGSPLPGDVNGDGVVDRVDLLAFSKAFLSHSTDAFYNPNVDIGHTGFISQQDGKFIERHLTNPPPDRPLAVYLRLPAGEQDFGHHPSVSGGATYQRSVTIIGRTTPDALVFADSGQGNFTFNGPALVADPRGFFSFPVRNREGINNYEFLAVDARGRQTIRAFPIIWIRFFDSRHFHYRLGSSGGQGASTGGMPPLGGGTGSSPGGTNGSAGSPQASSG